MVHLHLKQLLISSDGQNIIKKRECSEAFSVLLIEELLISFAVLSGYLSRPAPVVFKSIANNANIKIKIKDSGKVTVKIAVCWGGVPMSASPNDSFLLVAARASRTSALTSTSRRAAYYSAQEP